MDAPPSLAPQYDVALLLLSFGIGAAASFVAFALYAHLLTRASGRGRTRWLMLAAVCAGLGIWTAHFIAAMALTQPLRGYYPLPDVVALAGAIALAALAMVVAAREGRMMAAAGGAILGS